MIDAITVRFGIVNISMDDDGPSYCPETTYNAGEAGVRVFTPIDAVEFTGDKLGIGNESARPGFVETLISRALPDGVENSMITSTPIGSVAEAEERY